jgi:hypothetical protein
MGQERAQAALELGVDLASSGFHIFVSGLSGTEKLETLRAWVAKRVAQLPTPGDWVYVHNFAQADAPRAIPLASGKGRRLKFLITALIKTLQEELPKAFRQEAFDKEKAQLKEKYTKMAHALAEEVEAHAHEQGFHIQAGPHGQFILMPLVNGKLLDLATALKAFALDGEGTKSASDEKETRHGKHQHPLQQGYTLSVLG